jgi:peptide/nickel transport system substrate-binding protein
MGPTKIGLLTALILLLAACAPSAAPPPTSPGSQASAPPRERVLTASIMREPAFLAAQAPIPSQNATEFYTRMFNAYLDLYDDQGRALPYLAEALPQLNTDSWVVFPDGRMETRYRLKPNLAWHDGAPLTGDDFVFAFQLATPARGFRTAVVPYTAMDEVFAPDDRSVVIRWKSIYPDAGVLLGSARFGLVPLPRHILESVSGAPVDALQGHSYWAHEFVGAGPYRLDRWELGSYLEAVPFEGHVLGRAKIDRIRLMFMPDPNTAFANLLAGTTHMALDSLNFASMLQLKQEWSTSKAGTAGITTGAMASAFFQHRPEYANPRAILDVRVHRAMAYGIDRQTIADTIWAGELKALDTIFAPSAEYYPAIDRAIAKYPYDPRVSERLMAEAGYVRGADGMYDSPAGEQLTFVIRANSTRPEMPILAANWRQAGFDMQERLVSSAESADPQSGATHPGISLSATGGSEVQQMALYRSSEVRNAESRWRGENLSGYMNPTFDQLLEAFNVTLDQNERVQQRVQMAKLLSEELPSIPLTYNPNMHAYLAAVKNVGPVNVLTTGRMTWNIERWELS